MYLSSSGNRAWEDRLTDSAAALNMQKRKKKSVLFLKVLDHKIKV